MPHGGRPCRRTELDEIRRQIEENRKNLVSKVRQFSEERRSQETKKDQIARIHFEYAFAAACVLFTLENGTPAQKKHCRKWIDHFRNTNYGAAVDPCRRMRRDADFLEAFIQKYAPGWDWRKQTQDASRAAREERFVQERAQLQRSSNAHANRHVLPLAPDPNRLIYLAGRIRPNDPMTWPTLKEIKLTTALSERTIRQIIKSTRPRRSELVPKTPKRFAPRLLSAVVERFLERLPDLEIDEKLRSDCIEAARQFEQQLTIES